MAIPKFASIPIFAVLLTAGVVGAVAQGSDTGSGLAQSRRGATDDVSQSGKTGPVVHVGAGTTNASTTGYSGEAREDAKPDEKIDVPAVPNADLCKSYRDGPSYQGCLDVVLRKDRGTQ